ncbi:ClpP/crotonase [Hesseltinella vesiculosa]|uniref:ClpP/crotonase n=1 Tax=Hesseltinella vesiculosa TaxID=101127 RepID=A0A1X2GRS4_9FUNG|nr:ClpP/crotonase [Hesseltinella vesiculosa]
MLGLRLFATRPFPRAYGIRRLHAQSGAAKEAYLEHLQGDHKGISVLKLNRPATRNALSVKLVQEIREALDDVRFSGDSRVLIVQSMVDGVFCAGADLKERVNMTPQQVSQFLHNLRQAFRDLETLPVPTIAVLDGTAVGGGLEMALACDMRVAGPQSKLGLVETRLAIIPGAGGTQRLPRLIGTSKAKELIYTASILNNKQALEYGIVNHALEQGSAYDKALEIAEKILPNGPIGVRLAKQAIDRGAHLDMDSGLEVEQSYYGQVIHTKDRLEGLQAFKEKRKPVYQGH